MTCFGHDQRSLRYLSGNCNHPCNARGGCFHQSNKDDTERYDTGMTIPYNLKDGE
jgi:hypothetical protein